MSDYISRDELLELYAPDPECDKCSVPFPVVRQNILNMPAADVVEVVRCGKCRHAEDSLVLWCNKHEKAVSRLDFCSHGARMDKEAEDEA